jgi:hypothetical protein
MSGPTWPWSYGSAIFQLFHVENKFIFNETMMMMNWIFIVLACWNNSPRIDTSLH